MPLLKELVRGWLLLSNIFVIVHDLFLCFNLFKIDFGLRLFSLSPAER